MKCEVCLKLLEEYVDSELGKYEAEKVSAHLTTCASCASEFDALTVEQEIYARYDRALEISPSMWGAIAESTTATSHGNYSGSRIRLRDRLAGLFAAPSLRWSFAGALTVLLVAVVIGVAYLRTRKPAPAPQVIATVRGAGSVVLPDSTGAVKEPPTKSDRTTTRKAVGPMKSQGKAWPKTHLLQTEKPGTANQSDVLFPDVAYSTVEEQDTQKHIEQAQNLLRSIRNIEFTEDDAEIDVSYEKALSRQLLNENVVLRRDAEMSGKFPVKTLLSSLEPFLLDIANLPDKTSPDDLRVIKERVQKTEIVAALHSY